MKLGLSIIALSALAVAAGVANDQQASITIEDAPVVSMPTTKPLNPSCDKAMIALYDRNSSVQRWYFEDGKVFITVATSTRNGRRITAEEQGYDQDHADSAAKEYTCPSIVYLTAKDEEITRELFPQRQSDDFEIDFSKSECRQVLKRWVAGDSRVDGYDVSPDEDVVRVHIRTFNPYNGTRFSPASLGFNGHQVTTLRTKHGCPAIKWVVID